jgi:hypothetical protein
MQWARALPVITLLAACGGTAPALPPPLVLPTATASPTSHVVAPPAAPKDPFAIEGTLQEEWLPLLKPPVFDLKTLPFPAAPKGVAPAPAACDAFAKRAAAKATKCKDAAATLAALDAALSEADPVKRDALLVDVEACPGLPVGLARALRAELAPVECGDRLVEPLLVAPPAGMTGAVYHALFGQGLAARLARSALAPPTLAPPLTKARVNDFVNGPLKDWALEQSRAIQETAQVGDRLPYYGRAIAAVEAGVADLRFVEAMRAGPIYDEMASDKELREAYYGSLEASLEPRKDRGRNAALAGLKELAYVGALRDARADRARVILSRAYGGRRIDALDALLVPPMPPLSPGAVEERLALKLPTFYAGLVLPEAEAQKPAVLRAMIEQGISVPHRIALKTIDITPEMRHVYAHARLELGRRYWRSFDFDQAIVHAQAWPKDRPRPDELTLILALAIALRKGPEDAGAMIREAPRAALGLGNVAALDAVAAEKGRFAGVAAFDAAVVRQIATPANASADAWRDVARRFRVAEGLLQDPAQRGVAADRARAAEETAKSIP